MKDLFPDVKVGDEVVRSSNYGADHHLIKVTKVTARYLDTDDARWRRDNGNHPGERGGFDRHHIAPVTPQLLERVKNTRARGLARSLGHKLPGLSLDALLRIKAIVDEGISS